MSEKVKVAAKELIESLPQDADWDDVMYEVYVRKSIEEGLLDAKKGEVLTHEEVKKRFAVIK